MNTRTRRARRILRSARRGPWGKGRRALNNALQPVYGKDGTILHYKLVRDPWHTSRRGWYHSGHGASMRTKAAQRWAKAIDLCARWDADHTLSDCCGWGMPEYGHDPYQFLGSITPARNRPYPPEEHET